MPRRGKRRGSIKPTIIALIKKERIDMSIFWLIASIILWLAAIGSLPTRPLLAPAMSYLGLLCISFCESNGIPWLPVNGTMLINWLCITLIVMVATILQPAPIKAQARGMAYIIGGGIVGLAIGLLGNTMTDSINALYGIMIVATIVGIFFGFLLYSNTPDGKKVGILSGNFFRYLLAKGFPTAVTLMQIGLVLVLLIITR